MRKSSHYTKTQHYCGLAVNPSGVSRSFLLMMGKRCCPRTEHSTSQANMSAGLTKLKPGFDRQESLDATIPVGAKHVDSDGSGIFLLLSAMPQVSQDYPSKPVRMIEPFGAGGGPDLIARAVSPKVSEFWGQPVTVENHPTRGVQRPPPWLRSRQLSCSSTPALRRTAPPS
jgi:hypothetical protein